MKISMLASLILRKNIKSMEELLSVIDVALSQGLPFLSIKKKIQDPSDCLDKDMKDLQDFEDTIPSIEKTFFLNHQQRRRGGEEERRRGGKEEERKRWAQKALEGPPSGIEDGMSRFYTLLSKHPKGQALKKKICGVVSHEM